jgi:hypothetical protein
VKTTRKCSRSASPLSPRADRGDLPLLHSSTSSLPSFTATPGERPPAKPTRCRRQWLTSTRAGRQSWAAVPCVLWPARLLVHGEAAQRRDRQWLAWPFPARPWPWDGGGRIRSRRISRHPQSGLAPGDAARWSPLASVAVAMGWRRGA